MVHMLLDSERRQGPHEVVCRHPKNWGFVLYSQGTCWTSWPMPADWAADPLLQDDMLRYLPPVSQVPKKYS